eukprot:scaffold2830_cov131-Cylindrotheca_fusiformis.AAC.94
MKPSTLSITTVTVVCSFLTESAIAYGTRLPKIRNAPISSSTSTTVRHALVYHGGDINEDAWIENDVTTTTFSSSTMELTSSVSSQLDPELVLRVACSLAPPPHHMLHPKDCLGARLVSVSTTGAEIAVSVTTGTEGAAQVLIPIDFPQPCHDQACIVEKLLQLDNASYQILARKEWEEQNADQLAAQQDIMESLQEEPLGADLPSWWTFAALNDDLAEECSNLKDLLNEDDFASDLNALFQNRYQNPDFTIQAINTCVASVGPSGIYLRSNVERTGDYDDVRLDKYFTPALAIPFGAEAQSSDELPLFVLKLVESAGEMIDDSSGSSEDEASVASFAAPTPAQSNNDSSLARWKQYVFQRRLLEARLHLEQRSKVATGIRSRFAFQRELLSARIQMDRAANSKRRTNQKKAEFQRPLLEATHMEEDATKRKTVSISPKLQSEKQQGQEAAIKYAQIEDIGERAYAILKDLSLV